MKDRKQKECVRVMRSAGGSPVRVKMRALVRVACVSVYMYSLFKWYSYNRGRLRIAQEYYGAGACAVNILTILPERVRIRDGPRLALEEHLGLVAGKTVKVGAILRHKCLQFVERTGLLERLGIQAQCGVGRVDPGAPARGLLHTI